METTKAANTHAINAGTSYLYRQDPQWQMSGNKYLKCCISALKTFVLPACLHLTTDINDFLFGDVYLGQAPLT